MLIGNDVSKLRHELGLDVAQFATLLGINPSTVYRWEKRGEYPIRPEPLQDRLLAVLLDNLCRLDTPPEHGATFKANLVRELLLGGTLNGIYCVLNWHFSRIVGSGERK